MNRLTKILSLFLCTAMTFVCFSMPTFAESDERPFADGDYVIYSALASNMCISLSQNVFDEGTNVIIYHKYDGVYQDFYLKYVGSGYYKIINRNSGKILDAAGNATSGSNVTIWSDHVGANQLWRFVWADNGFYHIQNKNGCYLDVCGANESDGANVQVYTPNYGNAQRWKLSRVPTPKTLPENGAIYEIETALDSNMRLDVSGNGKNDGDNITIYARNNSNAQKFQMVSVGDGYFKMVHMGSGKIVDANGNGSSGNNVTIWGDHVGANNVGSNQLWRFESAKNGYYYIINKNGCNLDVCGANTANGNVWVYTPNWGGAQQWKLHRTYATPEPPMCQTTLIESNLDRVNYIKQAPKQCMATSVTMAINLIEGKNSRTVKNFLYNNTNGCISIDGKKYTGSNGTSYTAVYRNDNYKGSLNEEKQAIEKSLAAGVPAIASVHKTKSGTQHHWVVIVGKSGNDYLIVDPAEKVCDGSMRKNIKKMSAANYAFGLADYSNGIHYGYIYFFPSK